VDKKIGPLNRQFTGYDIFYITIGRQKSRDAIVELTEVKSMVNKKMSRYESPCTKYVYDPEAGDYARNIPPGTPFEELPDDWCCPECGAEKEYFEELED